MSPARLGLANLDQLVCGWLAEVSYRPGWKIQPGPGSGIAGSRTVWIHVVATVHDSRYPSPSEPTEIRGLSYTMATNTATNMTMPLILTHAFAVPPYTDTREGFFDWLASVLIDVERHESREFFKVGGQHWCDPHRDDNTRLYE